MKPLPFLTFISTLQPAGNASSPAKTGTLQTRSVTAAHLATDTPVRSNGIGHDPSKLFVFISIQESFFIVDFFFVGHSGSWAEHGVMERLETRPPPPPHGVSTSSNTYNAHNVGNLLFMAGKFEGFRNC